MVKNMNYDDMKFKLVLMYDRDLATLKALMNQPNTIENEQSIDLYLDRVARLKSKIDVLNANVESLKPTSKLLLG
tara:strand:- start:3325 stop:3549 length:225 start_codon:yes stop_codon:yes gene_type:complete